LQGLGGDSDGPLGGLAEMWINYVGRYGDGDKFVSRAALYNTGECSVALSQMADVITNLL